MLGLISKWRLAELKKNPHTATLHEMRILLGLYEDLMKAANRVRRLNRAADLGTNEGVARSE